MEDVGPELLSVVLSKLAPSPMQFAALSCVSKEWRSIVHEDLCKRVCLEVAPALCNALGYCGPDVTPLGGWHGFYKLLVYCPGVAPTEHREVMAKGNSEEDNWAWREGLGHVEQKPNGFLTGPPVSEVLQTRFRDDVLFVTSLCRHGSLQEQSSKSCLAYRCRGIVKNFRESAMAEAICANEKPTLLPSKQSCPQKGSCAFCPAAMYKLSSQMFSLTSLPLSGEVCGNGHLVLLAACHTKRQAKTFWTNEQTKFEMSESGEETEDESEEDTDEGTKGQVAGAQYLTGFGQGFEVETCNVLRDAHLLLAPPPDDYETAVRWMNCFDVFVVGERLRRLALKIALYGLADADALDLGSGLGLLGGAPSAKIDNRNKALIPLKRRKVEDPKPSLLLDAKLDELQRARIGALRAQFEEDREALERYTDELKSGGRRQEVGLDDFEQDSQDFAFGAELAVPFWIAFMADLRIVDQLEDNVPGSLNVVAKSVKCKHQSVSTTLEILRRLNERNRHEKRLLEKFVK